MLTSALLALYATTIPQEPQLVDREYDLSALSSKASSSSGAFYPNRAFRQNYDGDQTTAFRFEDEWTYSSPEEWAGVLMDLFEESIENEDSEMDVRNLENGASRLFVRASEGLQREVQQGVDKIMMAVTSGAEMRIEVFSLPANAPTQLLERGFASDAELEQLRAQVRPVVHTCFVPRAGSAHRSDASTHEMIVGYDVEIAQQAFIHEPVRVAATQGLEFLADAGRLPGGYWLSLGLQHCYGAAPAESRTISLTGMLGGGESVGTRQVLLPGKIDEGEVGVNAFTMDTFVPDDGALVFGARSRDAAGDPELWVYAVSLDAVGSTESYIELTAGDERMHLVDGSASSMGGWSNQTWAPYLAPVVLSDLYGDEAMYRTEGYNEYADWAAARMIGGWAVVKGNPARSEYAVEQLEVLESMRNVNALKAKRSPVLELVGTLDGKETNAVWIPVSPNRESFAMTGRFGLEQVLDSVEVASGSAAVKITPYLAGEGLVVGARMNLVGQMRMTAVDATARLGVTREQRALLSEGAPESELLSAHQAAYEGQVVRPAGAPRAPIAGGAGGDGAVIEMRLIE